MVFSFKCIMDFISCPSKKSFYCIFVNQMKTMGLIGNPIFQLYDSKKACAWSAGCECFYLFFVLSEVFFLYKSLRWRSQWSNGYRHRKWTRRHEFKSWTRLIAFHIALIHLGKVWIQLFSFQLWVNSSALVRQLV